MGRSGGRIGFLLACLVACGEACALDPSVPMRQFGHTVWRVQDGELTGIPSALAQTADGYLWIGTNSGTLRYDGVRFAPLTSPSGNALVDDSVLSLLAARDGALWLGLSRGLVRWKDGVFQHFDTARINKIAEDGSGTVWFSRARSLDKLGALGSVSGGVVRHVGRSNGLALDYGNAFTTGSGNDLWVGSSQGVVQGSGNAWSLHPIGGKTTADGFGGPAALEVDRDGSIWAGFATDAGRPNLLHWTGGQWNAAVLPGENVAQLRVTTLLVDREGVLWIGTADRGLFRLHDGRLDHFEWGDGLSGNGVNAFLEDAEGDLWVATNGGLDRFRTLRIESLSNRDGLIANSVQSLAAAPDGSLWIGNLSAIEQLRAGQVVARFRVKESADGSQFNKVLVDRGGRVWAGVDDDLAVLEGRRFKRIRMPDGKPVGLVVDMAQDAEGSLWVLTVPFRRRLLRVQGDRVVQEFSTDIYRRVMATGDGQVWTSITEGHRLARYQNGHFESFAYPPFAQSAHVLGLQQGPDGTLFGSSSAGLVAWRAGEGRTMTVADGLPCQRLFGLALDKQQALWLYGACGVMRISADDFRKWWSTPGTKVSARLYDAVDGAQPDAINFGTSGTTTSDGRVWFANGTELQSIDPAHVRDNPIVPQVHIEAVVVDHRAYPPSGLARLPANPNDLEIDYTATSLVAPQKVSFFYKLDGFDRDWRDAGARRQAFYTELRPGRYRFHVIACNNDGLWNEQGASFEFDIPPTFVQTGWFIAACIAALTLVLWGAFHMRLRQLRASMHARAGERERIAGELHDTLLQGVQGLVIVLQARVDGLGLNEEARQTLGTAVDRANALVVEGRDRIRDLRSPASSSADLFAEMEAEGRMLDATGRAFRSTISGPLRLIEPDVREELRRFVGEALSNAFRHADAGVVKLTMEVGERALSLSVIDDGRGQALERAGGDVSSYHWGIKGMRERAQRIGARFLLDSRQGLGTDIRIVVPAARAYVAQSWAMRWLRFWRQGG